MTEREIIELAYNVRQKQKEYFKRYDRSVLAESKKLEKMLDGQTAVGYHKQAGPHSVVQVQQLYLVQVQGRGHRRPPEGRYPLVQRYTSKLQHRGYG